MRPRGEGDISPLACPDFNGNTIAELHRIRNQHEREALRQQQERLEELRAKTSDAETRAQLEEQIAAIETTLNA